MDIVIIMYDWTHVWLFIDWLNLYFILEVGNFSRTMAHSSYIIISTFSRHTEKSRIFRTLSAPKGFWMVYTNEWIAFTYFCTTSEVFSKYFEGLKILRF